MLSRSKPKAAERLLRAETCRRDPVAWRKGEYLRHGNLD